MKDSNSAAHFDLLVTGCGLTGSVIARCAAEKGKKVLILERRNHIGGNMYDYRDEHGILIQKYGPHIFHAEKKYIRDFMFRFEDWHECKTKIGAFINGKHTYTPFNFGTIDTFYTPEDAEKLKLRMKSAFPNRKSVPVLELMKHSDNDIREYAEFLFRSDYAPYTAKQWGISPDEIDPSVLARVPVKLSYDSCYFGDDILFEAVPADSFTKFFENLLNHENICVKLGCDSKNRLVIHDSKLYFDGSIIETPVVYTGEINELFGNKFGTLPYRSLHFELEYSENENKYPASIEVFPQEKNYTRITEYKSLLFQKIQGSIYSTEYPLQYINRGGAEPYYPVLTAESQKQYAQYREEAEKVEGLICCGRLGDFKYYNMDMALERALSISEEILQI